MSVRRIGAMWTCARCQHQFVNRNQSHSCGKRTAAQFLRGRSRSAIALFNFFLAEYRKIGGFELHPVKTRVALLTKMRFCAINKLGRDFIDVHFVLTRPHRAIAAFRRIENISNRYFVHHLRISNKSDITPEIRKVMTEAYGTGNRVHVDSAPAALQGRATQ